MRLRFAAARRRWRPSRHRMAARAPGRARAPDRTGARSPRRRCACPIPGQGTGNRSWVARHSGQGTRRPPGRRRPRRPAPAWRQARRDVASRPAATRPRSPRERPGRPDPAGGWRPRRQARRMRAWRSGWPGRLPVPVGRRACRRRAAGSRSPAATAAVPRCAGRGWYGGFRPCSPGLRACRSRRSPSPRRLP